MIIDVVVLILSGIQAVASVAALVLEVQRTVREYKESRSKFDN